MVHILAPVPPRPDVPLFFNLDSPVGKGAGVGDPPDVMLVQFLLRLLGEAPPPRARPPALAAWRAVDVTGRADIATAHAILALQDWAGLPPTGMLNMARGYRQGGVAPEILHLNEAARRAQFDLWPNLDRFPDCPEPLARAVRRALAGTPPA
jgi:hypothetical protein